MLGKSPGYYSSSFWLPTRLQGPAEEGQGERGESTIAPKYWYLLGCPGLAPSRAPKTLAVVKKKMIGRGVGSTWDNAGPLQVPLRGYYGKGKYLCSEDDTLHFVNGSHPVVIITPTALLSVVCRFPFNGACSEKASLFLQPRQFHCVHLLEKRER